ncbi:EAL domain-containing protein [Pseudarthrobacter phenanthrenivorans]|uniref:EAL domain-containing protein n=2 Tax=Pseudarthrobacter phenanthrenivorans TaxID=361575 RepID=A0A3B0FNY3_PSEPS|nr:EAL domain-containing protein [Pseudarthrobacter phenanthrenivorans]ADX71464.1 diguanylate cyclase/phosphodiesterase [Pseudarthrobacter phenanthrenivorans Sphe3]RKO23402.1 EAL domain-containing protein [Pseudarthrobacter phenanthrenivorans]TPV50935.1 EAL domain-containing protein [Pseudarthrobacter phenanthrenivorans]
MFADNDPRLSQLLEGIVRLASGDLNSRIEVSPARDELDAIIMGTNLLAEDLQIIYEELEQRVQVRTQLLHEAHLEMQKMAMQDPLTGLANRSALIDALKAALEGDTGSAEGPVLLLMDLDAFKSINDSLGHTAGDHVLITVGERIRSAVRESDVVARLGGDEFAIVLPAASPDQAGIVGHRILAALAEPVELPGRTVRCGASIGLSAGGDGKTPEDMLMEADVAMYASKAEGQNRLHRFEPGLLLVRRLRSQLLEDLRAAIRNGGLTLHYQPVVELATGRIEGVEALVRWNHPTRGFIMPDEFIPLAEEAGLISELGLWVLRTAVHQLRDWIDASLVDSRFSVRINISASDLQSLQFIEDVRNVLKETGVRPDQVVLELTEVAIVKGNELDRYSLGGLRGLGVGIEIDDFGTGYSSISYLRRLPVDRVKVDRSLIVGLGTDPTQPALVAAVLQLIRACGLEAVWEGVETAEQAELLRGLGCLSAQGYFFSRPVPPGQIPELLADRPESAKQQG